MDADYDWGNLIVQVVIALATIGTLIWAIRVNRGESRRASVERKERLAFEERAQATRISAWEEQRAELKSGEPAVWIPSQTAYEHRDDVSTRRRIYVHNGSDAPVYDVAVRYQEVTHPALPWVHAILPPGAAARSREVSTVPNCGAIADDVALEVEFRDAAGRYWLRESSGILKRRSDLDSMSWEQAMLRRMELPESNRIWNEDSDRSPEPSAAGPDETV
ncbi:hypothetical protein [Promicromonospora iranensis]|uniref:hypothetical protein n=1 Tax=Promicromonospora iranensis TaxID=1105144 RepID=UPI0023A96BBD|nr:hypothetical protein [Promicromonospora iranensis]